MMQKLDHHKWYECFFRGGGVKEKLPSLYLGPTVYGSQLSEDCVTTFLANILEEFMQTVLR